MLFYSVYRSVNVLSCGDLIQSFTHQDQIFDKPSAFCLAVGAKHWIRWGGGGGGSD